MKSLNGLNKAMVQTPTPTCHKHQKETVNFFATLSEEKKNKTYCNNWQDRGKEKQWKAEIKDS